MLSKLPPEILLEIFEYFTFHSSGFVDFEDGQIGPVASGKLRTLSYICRTSKQCRQIAEPLLYQTYIKPNTVSYENPKYSDDESTATISTPKKSLRLFLRRVTERPDLAKSVRSIYLGLWNKRLENIDAAMLSFYDTHDKISQGREMFGNAHLAWRTAIMAGNEDAEIALLLMMTPNVRDIWFTMPAIRYQVKHEFWFSLVFEHATLHPTSPHPFKSLSMVYAHYWDQTGDTTGPRCGFPLSPFQLMTRIPSLRTFDTIGMRNTSDIHNLRSSYPSLLVGSSKIEKLFLQNCVLTMSCLENLLSCFVGLRTLFLQYGQHECPGLSWPVICRSVGFQRRTLETLHLTHDNNALLGSSTSDPDDVWEPIPTLAQFIALKQLVVDQSALLGPQRKPWYDEPNLEEDLDLVSRLPSSLEVLGMNGVTSHVIWRLERLVDAVREKRFPNLRDIFLDMLEHEPDEEEQKKVFAKLIERPQRRIWRLKRDFRLLGVTWHE